MNKPAATAIVLLALGWSASASAADLAARPYTKAPGPSVAAVYDWSGFYVGLNGGGAWSHKCWEVTSDFGLPIVPALDQGCHDATGGVAGGQLGYRMQSGAWVFGLEGQGDWANLTGSNGVLQAPDLNGNRTKIDAIGLITGQIGYAVNNVLFYVKGGAMVVNDRYEGFTPATGAIFDRGSEIRYGGAVGAGIDFGISPNIVLGVDYMHGFLGTRDVSFTSAIIPGLFVRNDRISQDVDMVTARISYKFGGPVIAKY